MTLEVILIESQIIAQLVVFGQVTDTKWYIRAHSALAQLGSRICVKLFSKQLMVHT